MDAKYTIYKNDDSNFFILYKTENKISYKFNIEKDIWEIHDFPDIKNISNHSIIKSTLADLNFDSELKLILYFYEQCINEITINIKWQCDRTINILNDAKIKLLNINKTYKNDNEVLKYFEKQLGKTRLFTEKLTTALSYVLPIDYKNDNFKIVYNDSYAYYFIGTEKELELERNNFLNIIDERIKMYEDCKKKHNKDIFFINNKIIKLKQLNPETFL